MWHPLEIPRSKTKTHGNSIQFFIEQPWKFHFLFDWPLQYPHALSSIHLETRLFHFLSVQGYGCKDPVGPFSWFFQGFLFQSIFFQGLNLHSYLFRGGRLKIFSGIIFFRGIKSTKIQFQGIYKSNNHSFQTYWFLKIWSSIHLYR